MTPATLLGRAAADGHGGTLRLHPPQAMMNQRVKSILQTLVLCLSGEYFLVL
jgi:hypothetical protein